VRRLEKLGPYEFNAIPGERRTYVSERWMTPQQMTEWLERGAGGAASGDVYARLRKDLSGGSQE
jgi:hypothetical protein